METEHWVYLSGHLMTTAAVVVAATAAFWAIRQYKDDRVWKRKDRAAAEIERVKTGVRSRSALMMIEWVDREIRLFPDADSYREQRWRVTPTVLARALLPDTLCTNWNRPEGAIRDCFDDLLENLENIEMRIRAGVILEEDVAEFFSYWALAFFDNTRFSDEFPDRRLAIRNLVYFTHFYGYEKALALMERFAENPYTYRLDLIGEELRKEVENGRWKRHGETTSGTSQAPTSAQPKTGQAEKQKAPRSNDVRRSSERGA